MRRRLYRSRSDYMLGGVCGGLAEYLGIDSILVRLFFVLLALGTGGGAFIYLLLWILVPREGEVAAAEPVQLTGDRLGDRFRAVGEDVRQAFQAPNPRAGLIVGLALVVLGVVVLAQNLDLPWLTWFDFDTLWPALLILAGVALIVRRAKGE